MVTGALKLDSVKWEAVCVDYQKVDSFGVYGEEGVLVIAG